MKIFCELMACSSPTAAAKTDWYRLPTNLFFFFGIQLVVLYILSRKKHFFLVNIKILLFVQVVIIFALSPIMYFCNQREGDGTNKL